MHFHPSKNNKKRKTGTKSKKNNDEVRSDTPHEYMGRLFLTYFFISQILLIDILLIDHIAVIIFGALYVICLRYIWNPSIEDSSKVNKKMLFVTLTTFVFLTIATIIFPSEVYDRYGNYFTILILGWIGWAIYHYIKK
jgi:uncharacterized membrane protein